MSHPKSCSEDTTLVGIFAFGPVETATALKAEMMSMSHATCKRHHSLSPPKMASNMQSEVLAGMDTGKVCMKICVEI